MLCNNPVKPPYTAIIYIYIYIHTTRTSLQQYTSLTHSKPPALDIHIYYPTRNHPPYIYMPRKQKGAMKDGSNKFESRHLIPHPGIMLLRRENV